MMPFIVHGSLDGVSVLFDVEHVNYKLTIVKRKVLLG